MRLHGRLSVGTRIVGGLEERKGGQDMAEARERQKVEKDKSSRGIAWVEEEDRRSESDILSDWGKWMSKVGEWKMECEDTYLKRRTKGPVYGRSSSPCPPSVTVKHQTEWQSSTPS
jgi:hypothetical protein